MYSEILIRYGEMSLKGKNKMAFIKKLGQNIETLTQVNPKLAFDHMRMPYSLANLTNLQYVFGIYSFSPVVFIQSHDVAALKPMIKELIQEHHGQTFRVTTKRGFKAFKTTSAMIDAELGAFILKTFPHLKVNLTQPDFNVELDIREDGIRLFTKRILGLGGLPTGINGKVLHLISGGIDSPVAAFKMMKRGIHVDFLNFITPPHTDQLTINKVNAIVQKLVQYQGRAKLYRFNYTNLMNLIGLTSKQAYKINLMRRSFYRIANTLAHQHRYLGLSNGENLGQVASQTLESIAVISAVTDLPIYRPLLSHDKLEIIDEAEKIQTYALSIQPASEACELFAPKAPVTKPRLRTAQHLERELSALNALETEGLTTIETSEFQAQDL